MAAPFNPFPSDGAQRLVIRAQQSMAITYDVVMGALSFLGAGAMLVLGTPVGALICLAIGGGFCYVVLSAYLWADPERVGVSRLPWGASCRRDQLERLQIVHVGRSRRACAFVRRDGHTAFRVRANLHGTTQLKALAAMLGVPYYDLFSGSSIDIQPGL